MTAQHRAALLDLVGSAAVVADLAAAVARHRRRTDPPAPRIPFDVPDRRDYLRRRRAAGRLLTPLAALEQALAATPLDLLQALAGSAPHLHCGSLSDFTADVSVLREDLWLLARLQRGQRGAPRNWRRRALEDDTLRVLRRAGVRCTKGRDGVLARVLSVVYEAAGESGPEDLFPVLARLLPARRKV